MFRGHPRVFGAEGVALDLKKLCRVFPGSRNKERSLIKAANDDQHALFADRLAPWVHYVLIHYAYSDLYDALVFFRSALAGRGVREELVAKIARGGVGVEFEFLREAMVTYLFSLVPRVRNIETSLISS
ncbi:hypothetical protein AZE42_10905 [Rhizopogon vesiculosus]|uniref:Uncharacterized protein n=1 Tax=Rhizopogon vesiculosus TaxID=180088 RepID=A0A1J8QG57_9AGAM|nr:hypothetical protein AZE42_10905 [Rhizopogon vesiculosus]